MDSIAAKQFLISKIVKESEVENVLLSEVERKMLHFTEVHPTLPDIYQVNEEFERTCDSEEYEAKIAGLLRNARARDETESPLQRRQWKDAIDTLRNEDHYILVMVQQAFGTDFAGGNRFRNFLIYLAVAVGLILILFLLSMWRAGH